MALPHGAVGLSAMCNHGVSWSYSLHLLPYNLVAVVAMRVCVRACVYVLFYLLLL